MSRISQSTIPSELEGQYDAPPFKSLVRELAAVTLDSTDLDAWERFGSSVLGMSVRRDPGELRLKMDDYPYRFRIRDTGRDGLSGITWVGRGPESVTEIRDRWERRGGSPGTVMSLDWNAAEARETYAFEDHQGVVHEVFDVGPGGQSPFEAGPDVAGFVTGDAGLGHIVFFDRVDLANRVFQDTLAMSIREDSPLTVGGMGRFYGCNSRHHSAAAVEVPGRDTPGIMHVMIEMLGIDDVGAALDRAASDGWKPRTSLGRHPDNVLSFYVPTPGGFDMEVGCDGWVVPSDAQWDVDMHAKRARIWGHTGIGPGMYSD